MCDTQESQHILRVFLFHYSTIRRELVCVQLLESGPNDANLKLLLVYSAAKFSLQRMRVLLLKKQLKHEYHIHLSTTHLGHRALKLRWESVCDVAVCALC